MDAGPIDLDPEELEAMRFKATQVTPPSEDAPVPAEPATPEASRPTPPLTWEDLRNDSRSRDVIFDAECNLARVEQELHDVKSERGRARTEAASARQLHERYQKALREAAGEFNAAGIRCTVDVLVQQPAELPSLVRRLARTVKDITPDRDALRREVARLNGEALEHGKVVALMDDSAKHSNQVIQAGNRREEQLEATAAQIQKGRDEAIKQLKDAQSFNLEASRANDELRAKVEELQGTIAKLKAPVKLEAKAS